MMEIERIRQKAMELGAGDARWANGEQGAALLVFCAYGLPGRPAPAGKAYLSNYYPASQKGYLIVKELERYCAELGVAARERKENGVKDLAAQTLGARGKNSLFFHPEFGSLTSIHALETELDADAPGHRPQDFCGGCTLCQKACPTGAIGPDGFTREKCVRHYMGQKAIPPEYARHIYQLSGCELCQAACPKNAGRTAEAREYDLAGAVEGRYVAEIKALIGPNIGRRWVQLAQAMACAANTGCKEALPAIRALADDPDCGEVARWAADQLTGNRE